MASAKSSADEAHNGRWHSIVRLFRRSNPPSPPAQRMPSREQSAGFFSKLTFQWIGPLMSLGYRRPLEINDIWTVSSDREVRKLSNTLSRCLSEQREGGSKRPLAMALFKTFKKEIVLGGVLQLISACVQVLLPFAMKYLIAFAGRAYEANAHSSPGVHVDIGRGIGLVFGITGMQILQSFCAHHFIYYGMMVGGQARAALVALIFDKTLTISSRAKAQGSNSRDAEVTEKHSNGVQPGRKHEKNFLRKLISKHLKPAASNNNGWSNGQIVNLMSTDTNRIDQASSMLHMCWTAPIQIVLALVLLIINLGYSALAGFAFICIMTPLLGRAVTSLMTRRKNINKITDQRVTLTQEILSSMRFIKFYGWETSFLGKLEKIRKNEVSKLSYLLAVRNSILAVSMTAPVFAAILSFITFRLSKHYLDPAAVFSSMALFNALRVPLNLLPMVTGKATDALISINRIDEFLTAEDAQEGIISKSGMTSAVQIRNATFTWEKSASHQNKASSGPNGASGKPPQQQEKPAAQQHQPKNDSTEQDEKGGAKSESSADDIPVDPPSDQPFRVSDIDLDVGRTELVAVIGAVGSGKSTLLSAIAGDVRKLSGHASIGSTRAFCPQSAWIQSATIRHNICFGKPFDQGWYDSVVHACALGQDFDALPAGDMTEVGERGVTVSGGQKQRINLARAMYSDADIVLMDDPLSAVDAHVGRHIMNEAICKLLKHKSRVLATHQIHILRKVDRIVWMKEGRIYKASTFTDLSKSDAKFQKLLATRAAEEEEEDEDKALSSEDKKPPPDAPNQTRSKMPTRPLMSQEDRSAGKVGWDVYIAYVKASGSIWAAPALLILLILSQGANVATGLWLSWWTSGQFAFSTGVYAGGYTALGFAQTFIMLVLSVSLTVLGARASGAMLQHAVGRVLRSPMSFFDTTPIGRITNRFTRDVDVMDNQLTEATRMFFFTLATIVAAFVLILAYYYYFAIALVPVIVLCVWVAGYYRASARELKRHEAVLRGSVLSRFSETIGGASTIRAYGMQSHFADSINESMDSMDGAYFLTFANQRWLSVRLDAISTTLLFTVGILVVTSRFSVNASTGGLVLSFVLPIVQMIQLTVRLLADFQNGMNSTERIHYYGTQLEQEAPLHVAGIEVPSTWPSQGRIKFENVQMRYRPDLPLVLKGLSVEISGGERLGIVGRTGSGKSSMVSILFRLTELSGGKIEIDGIDIAEIGLHELRSRLSIIPQDPVLFRGTVRDNLDPFHEHADLELWDALRQADLVDSDAKQSLQTNAGSISLDSAVNEEGLNFSLGQRQLLALARALVRNSRVVVCDEATSSIDFETDQRIQRTIYNRFKRKTLLYIAHRLKSILDFDRILVLEAGEIVDLDTPINLFDHGGIFKAMCDDSGIKREDFASGVQAP